MLKAINWGQVATIVVAAVIVFFLQKFLTKKVTKADGSTSSYVGHDSIGHF